MNDQYIFKGTPGPWTLQPSETKAERKFYYILANTSGNPGAEWGQWVAESKYASLFKGTIEEALANAHLIAAAPDLLEALVFCQSVIKAQGMFDRSEQMAYDKAESAIQKALNISIS